MERNVSRLINLYVLRHRLLMLLIALLIALIVFPIVQEQYATYIIIIELFVIAILITGTYIVTQNKSIVTVAILLALLSFTILWFNFFIKSQKLLLLGLLLEICFFTLVTITVLRFVFSYKRINADKIYGGICGYLLIGIIWALIYTTIENAMPNSFEFSGIYSGDYRYLFTHRFYLGNLIYFSFVTLTTIGYGDIYPISMVARLLASLEAVTGQIYIAVLIGRLVGIQILYSLHEKE